MTDPIVMQMLSEIRQEQRDGRAEQRADHRDMLDKFVAVNKICADHETRLVVVENTRKSIRWLAVTMVGALLVGGVDFFFEHLPKLIASKP